MTKSFAPSLTHLQEDIERYLKAQGQVEKNEFGQTVFRGYPAALTLMYRTYLDAGALGPLVAELRKWNWEWHYDDRLLEVTARLEEKRDWPLLKELWGAVVAKRRTNYNKTREAHKSVPDKVPDELVTKTQALLLESLHRLHGYASDLGFEGEAGPYVVMIAKVENRKKA